LLGAVAPLGLAVAAPGPALVIDLDPDGPGYFGTQTLSDLVAEGPRRADLSPSRSGVAVLGNGGIGPSDADEVVSHLISGWPFVVLRLANHQPRTAQRSVPVLPLLPIGLGSVPPAPAVSQDAVYQDAGWQIRPPGPGLVLPMPRRATWVALSRGLRPQRDRWLRALRQVWSWA